MLTAKVDNTLLCYGPLHTESTTLQLVKKCRLNAHRFQKGQAFANVKHFKRKNFNISTKEAFDFNLHIRKLREQFRIEYFCSFKENLFCINNQAVTIIWIFPLTLFTHQFTHIFLIVFCIFRLHFLAIQNEIFPNMYPLQFPKTLSIKRKILE